MRGRELRSLSVIILGLLTLANYAEVDATSPLDVVINEIAWMGTVASPYDEWIEFYNNTDSSIDIGNWSIYGADTGQCLNFSIADGNTTTTVPAHGYLIYANHEDDVRDSDGTNMVDIWDATISMSNTSPGQVILYDAPDCGGNVIDTANQATGGWFAGDASERKTMERKDPTASGTDSSNWGTSTADGAAMDSSGTTTIKGTPKAWNSVANRRPTANAGPDQTVNVGDTVQLDGSGSSDPDGDPLSYSWSFISKPAGSAAVLSDPAIVNPTFVADVAGDYMLELTVDDGRGGTDSDQVTITAVNQPPACDDINATTDEDISVDIDLALYCTDPDGDLLTGSFISDPLHGTAQFLSPTIRYTPDENFSGSDSFTFRVSDGKLESNTATVNVTINEINDNPVANFGYSPAEPTDLDTIQFTDQSNDPDGNVVAWSWDFGDGNISTEQNPTHKYDDDGTYTMCLTVEDDDGAHSDPTCKDIEVRNVPPNAEFSFSPPEPKTDESITFSALSANDRDGSITRYEWDWDSDGTYDDSSTSPTIEHSFSKDGRHDVTLRVTDDDGATATATQAVWVNNRLPIADFSFAPETPTTCDEVQFTDNSEDPDGTIASWSWDFGDGNSSTEQNPGHRYSAPGIYTATLTVTDNDGAPGTVSKEIEGRLKEGDVDNDCQPTVKDAVLAAKFTLGLLAATEYQEEAADVVPPCGVTDARDVVRIAEVALGIKDESIFTCSGGAGNGRGIATPLNVKGSRLIQLSIENKELVPNSTTVINVSSSSTLGGIQVGPEGSLSFDPAVIRIKAIRSVPPFQVLAHEIDNEVGKAKFMAIAMGKPTSGEIIELEVEAVGQEGESTVIKLASDMVLDDEGNKLEVEVAEGRLDLGQATPLRVDHVLSIPNPVRNGGSVRFLVEGQGIKDVQVRIYDLSGGEVFGSGWVAGETFEWNLMSNRGRVVANSIYLYIVTIRGFGEDKLVRSSVKKLVVLR